LSEALVKKFARTEAPARARRRSDNGDNDKKDEKGEK
jgi:hypothetical protein